jgi:hypothetical protein
MLLVEQKRSRPVTAESQLVIALEKSDLAGPAFESVLDGFQTELIEHMHDEEVGRFPSHATSRRRAQVGAGRQTHSLIWAAPTHPHSHLSEHGSGTVVVEPMAALIDRVRDAVHRA